MVVIWRDLEGREHRIDDAAEVSVAAGRGEELRVKQERDGHVDWRAADYARVVARRER